MLGRQAGKTLWAGETTQPKDWNSTMCIQVTAEIPGSMKRVEIGVYDTWKVNLEATRFHTCAWFSFFLPALIWRKNFMIEAGGVDCVVVVSLMGNEFLSRIVTLRMKGRQQIGGSSERELLELDPHLAVRVREGEAMPGWMGGRGTMNEVRASRGKPHGSGEDEEWGWSEVRVAHWAKEVPHAGCRRLELRVESELTDLSY